MGKEIAERFTVSAIEHKTARDIVEKEHYLHRKPPVSYAYGLFDEKKIIGAVTFGTPPSRHLQMSACPENPGLVVELNRLWVHDLGPENGESWFLGRALRLLPPRIVVSYADTTYGHMGYVYRAANFKYAGWSDMERKTPRYDYVPADTSVHTRDAFRNGYEKRVRRKPKVRYWCVTGSKTDRKVLYRKMAWPDLDWKLLPPPTEHKQVKNIHPFVRR